jgi:hypothetical protein
VKCDELWPGREFEHEEAGLCLHYFPEYHARAIFHKSASREISSEIPMLFEIAGADGVAFTDGTTIKAADERLPSGFMRSI